MTTTEFTPTGIEFVHSLLVFAGALAAILMIASGMGDIWRGGLLLLVYGVGMTAPFVVAAISCCSRCRTRHCILRSTRQGAPA